MSKFLNKIPSTLFATLLVSSLFLTGCGDDEDRFAYQAPIQPQQNFNNNYPNGNGQVNWNGNQGNGQVNWNQGNGHYNPNNGQVNWNQGNGYYGPSNGQVNWNQGNGYYGPGNGQVNWNQGNGQVNWNGPYGGGHVVW